jgi:endonuclease YncB( thermonuclease family)
MFVPIHFTEQDDMKRFLILQGLFLLGVPRWMRRLVLLAFLVISSAQLFAETLAGRVVGVADGDTITVLDSTRTQHRIRLQGIDAPEGRQAFGNVSKRALSDMVHGKDVVIEYHNQDRYGRILGIVLIGGRDVNLEMVRAGMAWHYKQYQRDQTPANRIAYAQAEIDARAAGKGLWRDANPTAPWDFRRQAARERTGSGSMSIH